jgi:hypothetical protein
MGGGSGSSDSGQAIVVSIPSGSGDTPDDSSHHSSSASGTISDPVIPNGGTSGNSGTTTSAIDDTPTSNSGSSASPVGVSSPGTSTGGLGTSINPAAIPNNLFISDSNSSRSNQQNMGDDDSEDSDSEEDSSPEATRHRILTFLEAQRLAGERWTAKAISEKLDIPIEIARIAVINPIGRNVKVEIPDISGLYGGTLVAGDEDVLPFDGIKAIGNGLFAVVVFGVRVAVLSYGKAVELWQYIFSVQVPPTTLPAFPKARPAKPKTPVQGGGKLRKRWKDDKGKIYEWDYQHGKVEVYDKKGKHEGEFDPYTGEQTKPKDPNRRVEP